MLADSKGQILSCWAAAALLFTIWSPHHTQMGFCINREPDIWFQWHYQNRTSSPARQRDAGEPSSHVNISQHVWWLCVMQQGRACVRVCVCAQQSACMDLWIYAWPFPSVCLLRVCVDSFWGWCWPTCLSGLNARTKFRSPLARLRKTGEGENTEWLIHPEDGIHFCHFLSFSPFLPVFS